MYCGKELPTDASFCSGCESPSRLQKLTMPPAPTPTKGSSVKQVSSLKLMATVLIIVIVLGFTIDRIVNNQVHLSQTSFTSQTTYSTTSQTTYSTQTPPPMPTDENLTDWAQYAMNWFDYKYSVSDVHATRDGIFKIVAIYTFVQTYVTYKKDTPQNYAQSPPETLRLKTGDCEDYAILMASLCESVGLDATVDFVYASYGTENASEAQQKNHAMCMIYFNMNESALGSALSDLRSVYQIPYLGFWYIEEPSRLIVRDNDGFTYVTGKYVSGIWVSLENWDRLKAYERIDYSNDYLANFEVLRNLMDRPFVYVSFAWNYQSIGDTMIVQINVVNYGAVTARNVIVWAGLDAGNGNVYAQDKSLPFSLFLNQNRTVSFTLAIPSGVKTRVLVVVAGDYFERLEREGEWFETSARVGFESKPDVQGNVLTVTVTVTNYGEVIARNVVVWIGLDAGNDRVWTQSKSSPFQLGYGETKAVTLQIEIPRNVHTRLLVWVWGDNLSVLKSEGNWFDT